MKTISVKTSYEGIHCWPEAPDEVSFLREPHRHMFVVSVDVEVSSNDREIEFIMLKHHIDKWLDDQMGDGARVWEMGRLSCEQVAEMVLDVVHERCGDILEKEYELPIKRICRNRYISVTVTEDGENGATVNNVTTTMPTDASVDVATYVDGHCEHEIVTEMQSMNDYQKAAYNNIQHHHNLKEEMLHWAIGLGEEAGEVLSVVKHRYYAGCYSGDDDMLNDIINELGDTLWHIAALCTALGIELEDVARYNVAKLNNRYPDGKFDIRRSVNRHEIDEEWKRGRLCSNIIQKVKESRGRKRK